MQAPIDIQHAEKLRIYDLKFNYQPADLDIVTTATSIGFWSSSRTITGSKSEEAIFSERNSFSRTGRECRQW